MKALAIIGAALLYFADITIWLLDGEALSAALYDGLSIAVFAAYLGGLAFLFASAVASPFSIRAEKRGDYVFVFWMKLAMIPHMVYIFVMAVIFAASGVFVLPTIFFMASFGLWLIAWLMLAHSYLCVVFMGVPSLVSLYRGFRANGFSIGLLAGISLFFPVLNLFGSGYLFFRSRSL